MGSGLSSERRMRTREVRPALVRDRRPVSQRQVMGSKGKSRGSNPGSATHDHSTLLSSVHLSGDADAYPSSTTWAGSPSRARGAWDHTDRTSGVHAHNNAASLTTTMHYCSRPRVVG